MQEPVDKKPPILDYAEAALFPRWSKAAIACFVLGLISGPLALFLGVMTTMNALEQPTKATLLLVTCFGILAVILAAQTMHLRRGNRRGAELRGRALIIAGIIATCVWSILLVAFLYIVSQTAMT